MSGTIRTWSPPHSAVERLRLFALHGTEVLGEKIARSLGCHLAALEERSFEDVEHEIRPLETVAGCDVYVVHRLHGGPQESPNDKLCRLLFFIGALKDDGAARVTAVRALRALRYLRHQEAFPAFEDRPRPGGLFDHLAASAKDGTIAAPTLLSEVLPQLGPIWPSRLVLAGIPLGDCWRHGAIKTGDATDGLVPLHKLSQWLTYSLIEPLQRAGLEVTDIDGLTGLAEYRNGGLFVDHDVLRLRHADDAAHAHDVSSALVVEWRALTVALLDLLAEQIRDRLGRSAHQLPLAGLLEGGSWAAGRAIALERRADGSPPIKVISDGTVF